MVRCFRNGKDGRIACLAVERGITSLVGSAVVSEDEWLMSIFGSDKTFAQPINWTTSFFIGAFYGGAVAALFFFTWKAFAVAVVLWWVAGSLGIGHHRLWPRFLE